MSGIGVGINVQEIRDEATPAVRTFIDGLRSRAGLHEAIGRRARELTRHHLQQIAATRHDTAEKLGANPTGHWAQATEKTTMKSSAESATITINQPGIGRVAHDVTIYPKGMYLTLPLVAEAYGRRARRVPGLFFVNFGDHAALGKRTGKGADATVTWWYSLVTSVHQKQDRTLLPSDAEYQQAGLEGIRDYVDYLLSIGGGRDSKRGYQEARS